MNKTKQQLLSMPVASPLRVWLARNCGKCKLVNSEGYRLLACKLFGVITIVELEKHEK